MTVTIDSEQSPALLAATAEIRQLRSVNLPDRTIAVMLSRRHPVDVLRQLLPAVTIHEPPTKQVGLRAAVTAPIAAEMPTPNEVVLRKPEPSPASRPEADLRFLYTPLIQCTFPHSDPGDEVTTYTRKNGRLEVSIVGVSGVGLPYGVPARLLSIYVTSEIKRTHSREVLLGRSFADFLRRLELPVTGGVRGTTTMYRDQINRLIRTFFTIDETAPAGEDVSPRIDIRNARFCSGATVWWDKNYRSGSWAALEISGEMYDSMIERAAPLNNRAIRALRRSPLDLDIYAWLVYRLYRLNRPMALVTWDDFAAQTGQSYGRSRDFRTQVGNSLRRVLKEYPEARVELAKEGLRLLRSPRHIPE